MGREEVLFNKERDRGTGPETDENVTIREQQGREFGEELTKTMQEKDGQGPKKCKLHRAVLLVLAGGERQRTPGHLVNPW